MINRYRTIQICVVVSLVLFSVISYAGWRQDQEPVKKVESKAGRNSSPPSQPAYRQDQKLRDGDGSPGNRPRASKPATSSGFINDNYGYRKSDPGTPFVFDKRHHHRRYYPRQGARVTVLPRGYRTVLWHGTTYYFFAGSWYLASKGGFSVGLPPLGLLVPFLPSFYTTIWVGGIPYYYAGGVYYLWEPAEQAYRVTKAPPQQDVIEGDPLPPRLFVYPTQGQSEQQQAADRYECHNWAKSQADFDPTLPAEDIPVAEISQRGEDYNRAMKACLVARGYSVE